MANLLGSYSNIPPHVIKHMGGNLVIEGESWLPEDSEISDIQDVRRIIDQAFDEKYPKFEPQIIHTFNKDYFLPALKVLRIVGDGYVSPSRAARWDNMELKAECEPSFRTHEAPNGGCDCGIYGSVNLEEIQEYIRGEEARQRYYSDTAVFGDFEIETDVDPRTGRWVHHYVARGNPYFSRRRVPDKTFSLCIIEPMPNAKVIVCRKGWKASHVFISEIIGETMSLEEASELLSIAWHRKIDLRSLNENR